MKKDQRTSNKPVSDGQAELLGRMTRDAAKKYQGGLGKAELVKGHPDFVKRTYELWDNLVAEQALRLPIVQRPAWKVIKLGVYKSAEDYRKALKDAGFRIGDRANDIMKQPAFKIVDEPIDVELMLVTVAELGFSQGATRKDIYDKARSLRLQLCPPEIGLALRLDYQKQPLGECIFIGMEPIVDSNGDPDVFYVEHGVYGPQLFADCGDDDLGGRGWNSSSRWVFCRK